MDISRKEKTHEVMTSADFRQCAQVFSNINVNGVTRDNQYFNFWRVGNAFDTLIDYFVNVDSQQR